jgi:hypothetical protein
MRNVSLLCITAEEQQALFLDAAYINSRSQTVHCWL